MSLCNDFCFLVRPYQPTLDFAFFILEWTIEDVVEEALKCHFDENELVIVLKSL